MAVRENQKNCIEALHHRPELTLCSLSVATGETPILLDFSKNIITSETLALLVALARERGVEAGRDAMFRGDRINITENRPVRHID